MITVANIYDSKAALKVISELKHRFPLLRKVVADASYRGELIENVKSSFGWILQIVMRKDATKRFELLPQKWIVERTFAWFESYRRLSKEFEYHSNMSETMIYL